MTALPDRPRGEGLIGRRPPAPWVLEFLSGVGRKRSARGAPPGDLVVHVLVAGHDFRVQADLFPEDRIPFVERAWRRARHLVATSPGKNVVALVFDATSGEVATFARSDTEDLLTRVAKRYGSVHERDRYDPAPPPPTALDAVIPTPPRVRPLKVDQFDLLHILDVLDIVYDFGLYETAYVGELSFFTHGIPDGPQLFNSPNRSDHGVIRTPGRLTNPFDPDPPIGVGRGITPAPHYGPGPAPAGPPAPPCGAEHRDPCDLDARAVFDLGLKFIPPTDAVIFESAFARDATIRLWGGCVSTLDADLLLSTRLAAGYRPHGLTLGSRLRITPRLPSTAAWARSQLGRAAGDSALWLDVDFGSWSSLLRHRLREGYAARIAGVSGRPVYAPLPGLWAASDPGPGGFMQVPATDLSVGITEMATTYLGVTGDPEGRGYVVFKRDRFTDPTRR